MTITNLTAKENNGVVVAEFEAFGGKVKVQVNKSVLVEYIKNEHYHLYASMLTSQHDIQQMGYSAEDWLDLNLVDVVKEFINFNLQEAE